MPLVDRVQVQLGLFPVLVFQLRKPYSDKEIPLNGGHLKPITLKPVSHILRIFRVFMSAFSAFSAFLLCGVCFDPCFSRARKP